MIPFYPKFKLLLLLTLFVSLCCSPIPIIRSPKIRSSNISLQIVKDYDNGFVEGHNYKSNINQDRSFQYGYDDDGYFYLPYISFAFLKRNEITLSIFPFGGMANYKLLLYSVPYNGYPFTNINCALNSGAFGSFNLATDTKSNVNAGIVLSTDISSSLEFIVGCNYSKTILFDGSPIGWEFVYASDTVDVYYSYLAKTETFEFQTGIEYSIHDLSFALGFAYPFPLKIRTKSGAGSADFTQLNIPTLENPAFYYWKLGPSIQFNMSLRFKDILSTHKKM